MNKVIILPHGTIKQLARVFKCSRFTVSEALHTDKPGAKKEKIRKYISDKYGNN